ncbi:MAG: hypothetical protein KY475_27070, partial [Planctomycetes bacterium]|nr:hypothetical protein [Planctomycetota bacterium]
LGVAPLTLPEREKEKLMPAARPRSQGLVTLAKRGSALSKRVGLRRLRGRIKTSRFIRNLLYAPYRDAERPAMPERTRESLREIFRDEVQRLDAMLGLDLARRWGYAELSPSAAGGAACQEAHQ